MPNFAKPHEVDITIYMTAAVLSLLVASCTYALVRMTRTPKRYAMSTFAWIVLALVVLAVPQMFVLLIDAMNNTSGVMRNFVHVGPIKWVPSIVGLVTGGRRVYDNGVAH